MLENVEEGSIDGQLLALALNFSENIGKRLTLIKFPDFWKFQFGRYPTSQNQILEMPEGRTIDEAIINGIEDYLCKHSVLNKWYPEFRSGTFELLDMKIEKRFMNIDLPWCEYPSFMNKSKN